MSQEGPDDESHRDERADGGSGSTNPRIDHTSPKSSAEYESDDDVDERYQSGADGTIQESIDRTADDTDAAEASDLVDELEADVESGQTTTSGAGTQNTGTTSSASSDSLDGSPPTDSDGAGTNSASATAGSAGGSGSGSGGDGGGSGSNAGSGTTSGGGVDDDVSEYLDANGYTAGQFAREIFTSTAVDQWYRDPDAEDSNPNFPVEISGNTYGGWSEFDPTDVSSSEWNQLGMGAMGGSGTGGFRGDDMYVADISSQSTDADSVFRAEYQQIPTGLKRNELAAYGFFSALGVAGPRMRYDETRDVSYMEGADRGRDGVDTDELAPAHSDWANKVDREEALDMAATHLIAGNWDLKADNVRVLEDGSVRMFDYDRTTEREWVDKDSMRKTARMKLVLGSFGNIDSVRSGDLQIDEEDIVNRAIEIASEIDLNGQTDRLVRATDRYVKIGAFNPGSSTSDEAETIRNNIESISKWSKY